MQSCTPELPRRKGRILLVAASMDIMGGQAVQADLLLRHLRAEGFSVDFLPINPVPPGPLKLAVRVRYLRTLIVSIFYISSLLRRIYKYNVIHIFSASYLSFLLAPAPAILIGKLYGKRTILNYHSGEAEDHLRRWGRSIFWIIRKVDRIVVPSEYLIRIFARYGFAAVPIFNVADVEAFRFRDRTAIRPNILVARNLEPAYDIGTSVAVFREVKRRYPLATLTITGTGPEERRLKHLVSKFGLKDVAFTGRVERTGMPRLFNDADVMLNTSVIDNMPLTILEAFSAGLPVVTTNAGGIPYMIRHRENGMLIGMGDVERLAEAVAEVVEDDELRAKIIKGGRNDLGSYTWPVVGHAWMELYRELVGNSD